MNGPQKSQHFTFIGCHGLLAWNRERSPVFIYSPNFIIGKIGSSFCLFELNHYLVLRYFENFI